MNALPLRRDPSTAIEVLCLGAHSDDLEIGCGGTVLHLIASYPAARFRWIVLSEGSAQRRDEAVAGANLFLQGAAAKHIVVEQFRDGFFPYTGGAIKEYFERLKSGPLPDLIFTHHRFDLHQDHRLVSELTWNTFRSSLILEYEIPKWDGDLGTPNCYVPLATDIVDRKVDSICTTFKSQASKQWFGADTFRALLRLRGVEANAPFAEAFHARKLILG